MWTQTPLARPLLLVVFTMLLSVGGVWAQSPASAVLDFTGDARLRSEQVEPHTATHRFIQYREGGEVEVGRLSRSVERVNHTADEPAFLVSMQFRSPGRSGLDIVYLHEGTLGLLARYLTAPTGLVTVYVTGDALHSTFARRDGVRATADTTLSRARTAGAGDLVLASLELAEGETVEVPIISGAASSLAEALVAERVTYLGREMIDVSGVWQGEVRRFGSTQANGNQVDYFISDRAPHLIRQDFATADGRRFLRWELSSYGPPPR